MLSLIMVLFLGTLCAFVPLILAVSLRWLLLRWRSHLNEDDVSSTLLTGLGIGAAVTGVLYAISQAPHWSSQGILGLAFLLLVASLGAIIGVLVAAVMVLFQKN